MSSTLDFNPEAQQAEQTGTPPASMVNVLKYLGAAFATSAPADPTATGISPDAFSAPGNLEGGSAVSQAKLAAASKTAQRAGRQALGATKQAEAAGMEAAGAKKAADDKLAEAQKPVYEAELQRTEGQDARFAETLAKAEQDKTAAQNRYMTAVDDLKNTSIYNWWGQASTGAKVLGILSQALAGGLQGLNGQNGPTPLDRVIDQDLQVQRLNLQKKSDVAQQTGTAYRDLSTALKDKVLTENAMRELAYNSALKRLDMMAGTMKDGFNNASYLQTKAALTERMVQFKTKSLEYAGAQAMEAAKAQASSLANYDQMAVADAGSQRTLAGKMAEHGRAVGIFGVPGSDQLAKSNKEAFNKLKDQWDSTEDVIATGSEVKKLLTGTVNYNGKQVPYQDTMSKAQFVGVINQHLTRMKFAVKDVERLGQLSGPDEGLAEEAVGIRSGIAALIASKTPGLSDYQEMDARVQSFVDYARSKMTRRIQSYDVGGQPMGTP